MKKLVVFLLIISIMLIPGCGVEVKEAKKVTEEEKISAEYSLPEGNQFVPLDNNTLDQLLKNGTGILVVSNPENEFSSYFLKHLNNSVKQYSIEEIYYFDYLNIKDLTDEIVDKLSIEDDNFSINIYLIKKGQILFKTALEEFDMETTDTFDTDEFKEKINNYYSNIICKLYADNELCKGKDVEKEDR